MWFLTLQTTFVSILIIFIFHNLVEYFKDSYTTKKTKDVVGFHIQKYKTIMDELQETSEKEKQIWLKKVSEAEMAAASSAAENLNNIASKEKHDLSETELRSMNEDLADFIQRQMSGY